MTTTNAETKRCPRCAGLVILKDDSYGRYQCCLMCGWSRDVERIRRETVPKEEAPTIERANYGGRVATCKPTHSSYLLEVTHRPGRVSHIEVIYLLEDPRSDVALVQDVRGWPVNWGRSDHRISHVLKRLAEETGLTFWNFRAALR